MERSRHEIQSNDTQHLLALVSITFDVKVGFRQGLFSLVLFARPDIWEQFGLLRIPDGARASRQHKLHFKLFTKFACIRSPKLILQERRVHNNSSRSNGRTTLSIDRDLENGMRLKDRYQRMICDPAEQTMWDVSPPSPQTDSVQDCGCALHQAYVIGYTSFWMILPPNLKR